MGVRVHTLSNLTDYGRAPEASQTMKKLKLQVRVLFALFILLFFWMAYFVWRVNGYYDRLDRMDEKIDLLRSAKLRSPP